MSPDEDVPTGTPIDGIIQAPTLGVNFVTPWTVDNSPAYTLDSFFALRNRLWDEREPFDIASDNGPQDH